MTNQTILRLLDYLSNEARNSVHASFRLMALRPQLLSDPEWQAVVENGRSSADRLLRSIDDIRELLTTEAPLFDPPEQFDITLAVGETIELLNLASSERASRLILESPARPLFGRQHRRAFEQALMRVLDSVSKLGPKGEARVNVIPAVHGDGAQIEIVAANSNIALKVADWLNADADTASVPEGDDLLIRIATLVAAKRIRALGGASEFRCDARVPRALVISLPWKSEDQCDYQPELSMPDASSLNVLVAEDSDESFALIGILLQREAVWRAHDGLEALDMMTTRRFDLVFMDVHMPGLDGYTTIRSIRDWETQTGNARTPIVVLSSDDLETQKRSAAQSGCSGFMRKPLDYHDLFDLLNRLKAARALPA